MLKRSSIAALATLGIMLTVGPGARAQNTSCTTTMTGVMIDGNLIVPPGTRCTLTNVTVTGNVTVEKGATLLVNSGTINGNIRGDQCNIVFLESLAGTVSVGGNLHIENCTGESGYLVNFGSITINGNFQCRNNTGPCVGDNGGTVLGNVQFKDNSGEAVIFGATIHGNLQVSGNAVPSPGPSPGASLFDNTVMGNVQVNDNSGPVDVFVGGSNIQGNLQCRGNTPGVTDAGRPNTVMGNKLGQCAGL